jgi:hypothetical protein
LARRKSNDSNSQTHSAWQSAQAPAEDAHLDISMSETWLWDAACVIRGATDAPKFKHFTPPQVFFKRLSDVINLFWPSTSEPFLSEYSLIRNRTRAKESLE